MMTNSYRLPAEWEPQQAIILAWPHNLETWPYQLSSVIQSYLNLIREISDHQEVWVLVRSSQEQVEVERQLIHYGTHRDQVKIFQIPTHDAWIRDYGPLTLVNGQGGRLMTNWLFNGWGDKYDEGYFDDSEVPRLLSKKTDIALKDIPYVLEGGSIDVNGTGTLLTSTNCLLNNNRNSHLTKNKIENILCENLGVKKVIWVEGEIQGDDTDGHIDDAARFVNPNTIVCIYEENKNDINFGAIQNIYQQLKSSTDHQGRPFQVVKLPMPDPVYYNDIRLPASYANFLITNEKVLVPIYRCSNDKLALSILQEQFLKRKVVGIDGTDLVYGLGSIHCLSMQIAQ